MKDINLYIVRHGETEWNVLNQMQGSQNSPLTENGIEGAKITGRYLVNVPFVKAYSSPQLRAKETRDYILAERPDHGRSVPRVELDGLKEMDFGDWEGRPVPELNELEAFRTYFSSPADFDAKHNNGENYLDVLDRTKKAIEQIVAENDSGNILVVSHGTALRLLFHVLRGGDWKEHRDDEICPRILNTSLTLINYKQKDNEAEGIYSFSCFNNVDHLD